MTARRVLGVVLALVLIALQALPAAAGHGGGAVSWIEICGDGGARYVPVPGGYDPANDECDHCDHCSCLLSRSDSEALPSAGSALAAFSLHLVAASEAPTAIHAPAAERDLWPEKRGPPATKKSEFMTSPCFSLSSRYRGDLSDQGGIPCV